MTTALNGRAMWQHDDLDAALVAELHHRVGEALTAAHELHTRLALTAQTIKKA